MMNFYVRYDGEEKVMQAECLQDLMKKLPDYIMSLRVEEFEHKHDAERYLLLFGGYVTDCRDGST